MTSAGELARVPVRLGVGSYTFGWASGAYAYTGDVPPDWVPMSAEQIVDAASSFDLTVAQLCVRPRLHEYSDDRLAALKEYADERDVSVEVGTSGSDPEHLRDYLRVAKALGSPVVRTIMPDAEPDLRAEMHSIQNVLRDFEDAGVALMVENHEAYSVATLASWIRSLGSPALLSCLDPVNSLGRGEGVRQVVDALGEFAGGLHVKDFVSRRHQSNQEFTITGAVAGEGLLDTPWIIEQVLGVNAEASVVLELWTPSGNSLAEAIGEQERWAEQSVDYLKRVASSR